MRILVNGREVDKEVARQAGRRSHGDLLEAGARLFEYDRTMLHAKVLVDSLKAGGCRSASPARGEDLGS